MKILQILWGALGGFGGPREVRYISLHDFVQVLVRRSCGDPAAILLTLRSLHQDLENDLRWSLSQVFWDAQRKFLSEDLVRYSI